MIEARKLSKEYVMGKVRLKVLRDVSLQVDDGKSLAIMGPSGAGKSTLLHLLAGLDTPTHGDVLWEGGSVSRLSDAKRAEFRNNMIGIVFQFYHLLPELTALENVLLPGFVSRRQNDRALRERASECLEHVGLRARARHRPRELSGGEQQRVAIARALVNRPKMLLCDEPTGNLDSKTGGEVASLLIGLQRKERLSLVIVTHETELAALTDATMVLRDGQVVDDKPASRSAR